jgi:maleate isomerase
MVDREDCRKIREQRPDHIIIGAAGIEPYWGDRSRGERFEARLRESIESADITFGVQACVEALRRFGFKEIGILTGYRRMEEFQFNRYMREMGFDVVLSKEVPNEGVEEMKEAFRKLTMPPVGDRVQALLEIGTNLRCSRLASEMEEELGIPVISMNVATVWYVYRKNGIEDRVRGSGCLMWRF